MPNGRPNDHPLTDIITHEEDVYSKKINALVKEIEDLGGSDRIGDILWDYGWDPTPEEEQELLDELTDIKEKLE